MVESPVINVIIDGEGILDRTWSIVLFLHWHLSVCEEKAREMA